MISNHQSVLSDLWVKSTVQKSLPDLLQFNKPDLFIIHIISN